MRANPLHGPWLPNCVNCEQVMELKRLKAMPYAERCIKCQKLLEDEGMIDDGPDIFDSVLALHEVDDWDRARRASSNQHQRRIGGVPQEAV